MQEETNAVVDVKVEPDAANLLDPAQVTSEKEPEPEQETAEQLAAKEADAEAKAEKRREKRERKEYYELKAKAKFYERELERRGQVQQQDDSAPSADILEQVKQEIRQEYEAKAVQSKVEAAFKQAKVSVDDFREALPELTTPETAVMIQEVLESDHAPKLIRHLYENPEEADRIAELSPSRQAKEIWKLEQKLASAPVVKKSGAPAPIVPLAGKKTGDIEYHPDMSPEDYKRYTEQQHKFVKSYR
jgi:predicted RND superfamily exporter protein